MDNCHHKDKEGSCPCGHKKKEGSCPCVLKVYFKKESPASTSPAVSSPPTSPNGRPQSSSPTEIRGFMPMRQYSSRTSVGGKECRARTKTMIDQFDRCLSDGEYLLWQLENSIKLLDEPIVKKTD